MLKATRQSRIRAIVDQRGQVTVAELNGMLGVSEATVRRDLEELDQLGLVSRTHGGAVKAEPMATEPPLLDRHRIMTDAKRRIARRAAELVQPGDSVFLGSGTTVDHMAAYLVQIPDLTVITNSLPVVNALRGRHRGDLVVVGGQFRASEQSMIGPIAELGITSFRVDRVFMGVRAIDVRQGLTGDAIDEAMTDRAILGIAPEVVILADHTKFGKVSLVSLGPVTAAHRIISDTGLDPKLAADVQSTGVILELV